MDEELLDEESTEEEGDPVDPGDASDSPPADETEVPDVDDDGERPDIDWDVDPADGEAVEQQVFTSQPVPPYSLGDLWDRGASARLVCTTARTALEAFDPDDWQPEETPEDPPQTVTKTVTFKEAISDFSAESLASYRDSGARAYAIYDDGSRVQVSWDSVREPTVATEPDVIENEALILAEAINQHFWERSEDPDGDGAGTGAFVTDEEQDTFLEAMAQDVQPTESRPLHNLLMNAEGIALRAAKKFRASFTPSGVAFFDGLGNLAANIVAKFSKDGFLVGKESESHLVGDYHSLQLRDKEGNTYVYLSDLRNEQGVASVVYETEASGTTLSYVLPVTPLYTNYSISVSDGSGGSSRLSNGTVVFTTAPTEGATITVEFDTMDVRAKAFTLGIRSQSHQVGMMSVVEGYLTSASGYASHAEGFQSEATRQNAHAEGQESKAYGHWSHAEGLKTTASASAAHAEGARTEATSVYAHAEGSGSVASDTAAHAEGYGTVASGYISHAEGSGTVASGVISHAQNLETIAASAHQTAIGRYNVADNSDAYSLIIGNGNNGNRHNALAVDWGGSVHLAKSQGVYTQDTTGFEYPLIHDNGSNLWIGATATAAQHHKGTTLISTGHNGTGGNPSIRLCVPNAANNGGSSYYVYHEGYKPSLTALSGTLGINNGGTGSAGISISTGASLVTSANATVTACSLSKWGPLACLSVTFTPNSSWANGAQLKVGQVAAQANRPSTQVGGGAAGITAGCSPTGNIFANNHTGSARTGSTTLAFVYLCDI